ncbi:MAG: copper chaperone PCu(A)C [Alphaproteobacteria bacterium]
MRNIILAAMLAAVVAAPSWAHETKIGQLVIEHAYARASAGPAKNGAAYFTVRNEGVTDDRLVAVKSTLAKRTELHTHINDGGVMRMRPVEGGIPLLAGMKTKLMPGGLHVMMMGLNGPLFEGETIQIELNFEKAGSITIDVEVEGVAAGAHGKHKND